jgi:hypothetical protein
MLNLLAIHAKPYVDVNIKLFLQLIVLQLAAAGG